MKRTLSILALVLLFAGCKKDKKSETPASQEPAATQEIKRIKTIRQAYFNGPNPYYINNSTYYYNAKGQPEKRVEFDSTLSTPSWIVKQFVETYAYTGFNRVKEISAQTYKLEYAYDEKRKLNYEVWTEDVSDTTKYTYTTKQTIGTYKNKDRTVMYFYSQNLDSMIVYNKFNSMTERTVYRYNGTTDLVYSYLNQFYSLYIKDELISSTREALGTFPSAKTVYSYERTYNEKNLPVSEKTIADGVLESVTYYSFY